MPARHWMSREFFDEISNEPRDDFWKVQDFVPINFSMSIHNELKGNYLCIMKAAGMEIDYCF